MRDQIEGLAARSATVTSCIERAVISSASGARQDLVNFGKERRPCLFGGRRAERHFLALGLERLVDLTGIGRRGRRKRTEQIPEIGDEVQSDLALRVKR